ncbi:TonB-dependent siderophore receptor [Pseudomonas petrae]|uniref:TonB-dependent siderophore receptor n=1 Tax=Pseudomonas petrae TaxID=2912190 RepID=A0ABS9IBF3_9PSED|nr:TonB-dependent siderophore receptor [Pseudomonas petrae]MCF7535332.1 TonB-dependent siderophore receptor [Pseudomonas petrae]MCF7539011.1 TonB-dependent siderophore receptor [Pseudomonas petrae]MCF7544591.1 TonB-dependent siderophore receptor [Pseudomonas petrae]
MASNNKGQFKVNALAALVATVACHGAAWAADAPVKAEQGATIELQNSVVTGEAPEGQETVGYQVKNSTAGTKTSTPLSETPRSVSVVTRQRIQDQGSQTLTDILGYVPGIFAPPFAVGDGLAGDLFSIRGYNATDYGYGLLKDGLRLQGNRYDTTTEPYGLERTEVFRGPSSILYGENAPGGLVNLVSKRPTETAQGEAKFSYGSNNRRQLSLDVSGPLTDDNRILGRVVMLGRNADTQVVSVPDDRIYIAPSMTFNFDEDTALTLLSSYQRDRTKLLLGYPAAGTLLNNVNGKIGKDQFNGNPNWDDFERETWTLGYEFKHQLNDTWQFRQNSRFMESRLDRHETWPNNLNNAGFGSTLTSTAYDRDNKSITYSLDNQFEGHFTSGALENTVLLGASYDRTSFNQDWAAGNGGTYNAFNPVFPSGDPRMIATVQNSQLDQQMYGAYGQLQSKYDNWIYLLGGRQDFVNSQYRNRAGTTSGAADLDGWDHRFSWQTGLMYQFENGISPYVSYSTAFTPVQQSSQPNGELLDPILSEQYEMGLKYEPTGWNTTFSAAVFDLTKTHDVVAGSNGFSRQIGKSESKGVELEVNSDVTKNLSLTASYTYTDARVTKDSPGSLYEDHQLTGVPRNQASTWATYRFLDGPMSGFRVGGGVRYFDNTFAYTAPSLYGKLKTGDVTLVDALVGYDIDKHWSVDVNAKNLFDKEYVSGCNNAGRCYWGEERTVLGTVAFRW